MAARRKDREQGIYRRVSVRMWGDAKVRALTAPPPGGLVLWLHLLTGEQTGIIPGLHKIGEAAFAEQLGWPLEGFREAFREVEAQGMARADWAARVVWVPKAIEHNQPASPNVVRSWADAWDLTPECALKDEAWRVLRAFLQGVSKAYAEAFDEACPKPSGKTSRNQEQEQEQEKSSPPRAGARARAEGHSLDPEAEQVTTAARQETASGSEVSPAGAGIESPGAGGGNRTGPEDAAAQVNAAGGEEASPQRPDGGEAPGAADRRDTASAGRGVLSGLPTRHEAFAGEHPASARLLDALATLGQPCGWAASGDTRRIVEAAIGDQDIAEVAKRVVAAIQAGEKPWLGHLVDAIRAPRSKAKRTHGDLGAELRPWTSRLTREERAAAIEELHALGAVDPDLSGAPLGVTGCTASPAYEQLQALNEKWRARAEGRP